jgi:hypothetical protein
MAGDDVELRAPLAARTNRGDLNLGCCAKGAEAGCDGILGKRQLDSESPQIFGHNQEMRELIDRPYRICAKVRSSFRWLALGEASSIMKPFAGAGDGKPDRYFTGRFERSKAGEASSRHHTGDGGGT